ncbi:nucleoside deaminase [Inquilinus sp. CA228]|uniref:nucleoside deaminase n=1 Tax=Inquilinus sp. CA228 TaxID=3455609 RepID=UPI003F8D59E2
MPSSAHDETYLRHALAVARRAREKGNHPFGAVLVGPAGEVLLEGENTIVTGRDLTGHAERNLLTLASGRFEPELLRRCTLYASTEPCSMCAAAARIVKVGRIVYGLSQAGLYALTPRRADGSRGRDIPCRDVVAIALRTIEVVGPLLEDEARAVHAGFW